MKIRTNIQGSIFDIYPSGYDLAQAGKPLDFSNPNRQVGRFRSCHEFVELLLNHNPGITHQLSSSVFFHQQIKEIQQQLASGKLIAVQTNDDTQSAKHPKNRYLEAHSITKDSVSALTKKQPGTPRSNAFVPPNKATTYKPSQIESEKLEYHLTIEIAGRNLADDQFLILNKLDNEPSNAQVAENDNRDAHRSLVCFQNISQSARKLSLAIRMNTGPSPMLLPLSSNQLIPSRQGRSKPEWDNVIIPIKPVHRTSTTDNFEDPAQTNTTELGKGWLYIFWKGKLWRELEVSENSVMRDCRVEWYRNQIRFNQHDHRAARSSEGHALQDIWVPYKINNEYQLGRNGLRMAFSETQWSWNLIEALESGVDSLIAKTTSLDAVKQYSKQQHFGSAGDAIEALEIALKTSKGKPTSLKNKPSKIAAIYLAPEPNKICLKINDHQLNALAGKRYQLIAGNNKLEGTLAEDGIINESLPYRATEGELRVWCNSLSENPSHRIPLKLEQLAEIETTEGIQARLNNINHHAGSVDGITGKKTLAAIRQFQHQHQLTVDGIAGPITQKKLKEIHGN